MAFLHPVLIHMARFTHHLGKGEGKSGTLILSPTITGYLTKRKRPFLVSWCGILGHPFFSEFREHSEAFREGHKYKSLMFSHCLTSLITTCHDPTILTIKKRGENSLITPLLGPPFF